MRGSARTAAELSASLAALLHRMRAAALNKQYTEMQLTAKKSEKKIA